ncbi:MAG: SCO family protein [Cytophagaceae bacterium]|nr:SCO family protein [Cytophagaceae bacterium]
MYQIAFLRNSIAIGFSLLIFLQCKPESKSLPYYNTPDFTPLFLSQQGAEKEITHTIDDFSFTDQEGKTITQKNIEGKIHVANFFFTSCGSICPVMTDHLSKVQRTFLHDTSIVLLSYSVTPWIDSVSKLNSYGVSHHIHADNWHLLTGKKNDIYNLARTSYFAEEQIGFTKDSSDFLHTEHVLLVDRQKHIRGIYNATLQLDIQQLIADIQVLKEE